MRFLIATVAALWACAAQAQSPMSRDDIITGLSNVLASEDYCGLSYDPSRIEKWVSENVPQDDMRIMISVASMTDVYGGMFKKQSASAKVAHCSAAKASAVHFGFLED